MKAIENTPMHPAVEKRKHLRHPVSIQGIFCSGLIRGEEGVILDLSREGCRIFSSATVAPDSAIELQIRPRQGPSVFVPHAVVRWTDKSAFGVQFQALAGHESNRLARLLSAPAS